MTEIHQFAFADDDGLLTLREQMYQAPFVWHNRLHGVDPRDEQGVKSWHIEPLLKPFAEADTRGEPRAVELGVMRLPKGVYLNQTVERIPDLAVALESQGWRLATIWEVPLFAVSNLSLVKSDSMDRPAKIAWCLGSPVRLPSERLDQNGQVKIQIGPRGLMGRVPGVMYPLLSWERIYGTDPEDSDHRYHGWSAELRFTHWTNDSAKLSAAGIPLLLVR